MVIRSAMVIAKKSVVLEILSTDFGILSIHHKDQFANYPHASKHVRLFSGILCFSFLGFLAPNIF